MAGRRPIGSAATIWRPAVVTSRFNDGFTLIELLVSLTIFAVVITGIYSVYHLNQRTYVTQMQSIEMEQNLRAATLLMVNEIRVAGYDPTGGSAAGVVAAGADTLTITMDLDGDGALTGTGESITYCLETSGGVSKLVRKNPTDPEPVAENIDALNFVYFDEDGNVTASADEVRSVQIALVARTSRVAPDNYANNNVYYNMQGGSIFDAAGDAYRRKLSVTQVKCRNPGL